MAHGTTRRRSPSPLSHGRMHSRVSQQAADGATIAIARPRIGIQIPQQHEGSGRIQPTLATGIILQVVGAIEVITPEPDLVMIAAAVAPLRTIEHRRHRMAQQQMQHPFAVDSRHPHRQIQVIL